MAKKRTEEPTEAPQETVKSTERVRVFRQRSRQQGGAMASMMLSEEAKAALDIVCAHQQSTKVMAVEMALIAQAKKICPTPVLADEMAKKNLITRQVASVWKHILNGTNR